VLQEVSWRRVKRLEELEKRCERGGLTPSKAGWQGWGSPGFSQRREASKRRVRVLFGEEEGALHWGGKKGVRTKLLKRLG